MIIGHTKQWDYFKRSFQEGQMAHAFLFCGQNQIGKKTLTIELIKFINCLEKNKPCGKCKNCIDIEKGNFLDFLLVRSGKESLGFEGMISYNYALPDLKTGEVLADKKEIGIDQARKILDFLSKKSYFAGYKAVIIDNAENMTTEAQNCLLKTLEEPRGNVFIFLITNWPERILNTIYSRCQVIKFFATKEILKAVEDPEQLKKEKEILSELLKVISGSLAEKFAYAKNIKEDSSTSSGQGTVVLEIMQILQKYFKENILTDVSASQKLKLLDELIYKITFTNASPKLALEILFLEL